MIKTLYHGSEQILRKPVYHGGKPYVRAARALRSEWLVQKMSRDRKARRAYLHSDRMSYRRGDLYVSMILDAQMQPDDPRLRTRG